MQRKFSRGDGPTQDAIYDYSNTGPCVDIFAPGVDIYSACGGIGMCIISVLLTINIDCIASIPHHQSHR